MIKMSACLKLWKVISKNWISEFIGSHDFQVITLFHCNAY